MQRPCVADSRSQLWWFEMRDQRADTTDGRFHNIEHGDCLDVNRGAMTDGAHVVRWPCMDGFDQEVFRVSNDALGR